MDADNFLDVTPDDLEGKVIVKLYADDQAANPTKEFDQAGTLALEGCEYDIADETVLPAEANGWSDSGFPFCDEWRYRFAERYVSLTGGVAIPVRFDDYGSSGAHIYTSDADSANGMISADKEEIAKEWNGDKTAARSYLEARIKELDQYLSGEVYGFNIETPDGELLDSCWGFYGQQYATSEAIDAARHCAETEHKDQHFAAQHDIPTIAKES